MTGGSRGGGKRAKFSVALTTDPTLACPKCAANGGPTGGYRWLGPVFMPATVVRAADRSDLATVRYADTVTPECLRYQCPRCGFARTTKCADAPSTE